MKPYEEMTREELLAEEGRLAAEAEAKKAEPEVEPVVDQAEVIQEAAEEQEANPEEQKEAADDFQLDAPPEFAAQVKADAEREARLDLEREAAEAKKTAAALKTENDALKKAMEFAKTTGKVNESIDDVFGKDYLDDLREKEGDGIADAFERALKLIKLSQQGAVPQPLPAAAQPSVEQPVAPKVDPELDQYERQVMTNPDLRWWAEQYGAAQRDLKDGKITEAAAKKKMAAWEAVDSAQAELSKSTEFFDPLSGRYVATAAQVAAALVSKVKSKVVAGRGVISQAAGPPPAATEKVKMPPASLGDTEGGVSPKRGVVSPEDEVMSLARAGKIDDAHKLLNKLPADKREIVERKIFNIK